MVSRNFIRVLSLLPPVFLVSSLMAQKFDFNNGSTQSWTLQAAYDENGAGPFSNHVLSSWIALINHPPPDPDQHTDGLS